MDSGPAGRVVHAGNIQGFPDLDVEDVAHISVARWAVKQFVRRHGGTEREAEAQIRSLAEDIILMPQRRGLRNKRESRWVIATPHFEYRLILSEKLDVIGYGTKHAERTWAQVKRGVPSRLRKSKPPLWLRELVDEFNEGRSITLSVKAAGLYARHWGTYRIRQTNARELVAMAFDAFDRAMESWNGSGLHVPDAEHADSSWVLTEDFTAVRHYMRLEEQTTGAVVDPGASRARQG